MADTKISALPASTTPLTGTEVLPIVQSSVTKQVSVANLTAGRAVATGALTVTGAATVSTTLGVTGVATLGNGAILGIPASGTVTNLTGTASININGTVGATTPGTGAFTTVSATGNLTSLTAQFGSSPAGVSVGVVGIPNQKRVQGRNAANTGDVNILYVDGSNNVVFGPSDVASFSSTGLAVTGTLSATGTLSGGTSGTAYSFSGSAPATSLTLDSSGNLLAGTASALSQVAKGTFVSSSNAFVTQCGNGTTAIQTTNTSGTSIYYAAIFGNNGNTSSTCGLISVSGTTTIYAVTSDYRLKENIQPMTGALAKVAQLKPVTYKWKVDGSNSNGFIAHELAEVCPQAVSGEKDALKADGSIMPQGIDTSFLVATLTAAIQEQQALITQLTARITALETA